MKNAWISLVLGLAFAVGASIASSACPYSQTSASNDSPPPQQTAATGQAPSADN